MTSCIRSQSGNVIAADFRPRAKITVDVSVTSEVLYRDDRVILSRTTASTGGEPFAVLHFLGDLATGRIVNL